MLFFFPSPTGKMKLESEDDVEGLGPRGSDQNEPSGVAAPALRV
jgi:hypothetical protein